MKVVLTTPVEHDGRAYGDGDELTLGDDQAQALIDAGAAVAVGRKPRGSKTPEQLAADEAAAAADAAAADQVN